MALLFVDGFDHYTTAQITRKWTSTQGSVATTSTNARNGVGQCMQFSGSTTWIQKGLPTRQTVVVGVAFRLNAWASTSAIIFGLATGATAQLTITLNSSLQMQIRVGTNSGTVVATSTAALTVGTWYYLEFKATVSNTTGSVELRVNGVTVATFSGDTSNSATESVDRIVLHSDANGNISSTDVVS